MNCREYDARVTINAPPMPDKSEVIHKIMLSAIIILGVTIGQAIAAFFHFPGT